MHKVAIQDANRIIARLNCSPLDQTRILIAGGTGLIGICILNVLHRLIETQNMSIAVDCISKSSPNIHTRQEFPKFNFIQRDLGNEFDLDSESKYDLVIHAAGYGQPKKFLADEISTLILNGMTTIKLSRYLRDGGTFLFLSTSEVYLGSKNLPYNENDIGYVNSNHERAPYIIGKSYGETVSAVLERKGINAKIARISLAYGPGTHIDDDRVLNQLIKRGLLEGSIKLLDQGKAIRTYCYVADTVEMLMRIALEGQANLYNVGGESRLSIRHLADILGDLLSVKVFESEVNSYLGSAPPEVELDMTRYSQEFGMPDFINIQDGLSRTISWQRDELYSDKFS